MRPRLPAAEARSAILQAADRLLRSDPYRDLSVDGVMAEAGLSRTIFYRHFSDLPELVVELLREVAVDLVAVTDRLKDSISTPEDLREGLRYCVEFFVVNGPLVRAVAEGAGVDIRIDRGYQGFLRHFSAALDDGLRNNKKVGLRADLDISATADALNSLNERYLIRALGYSPQEDADRVLEVIWTIWSRTLFSTSS